MKKTIIPIITIILLTSSVSANSLLDQHNSILQSFTIFDSSQFKTYFIPDITPSGQDQLKQIWSETKELRNYRIQRAQEREQLEKELEKKSKRWVAIIGDDVYYGFDEEIYGAKEFYLYWE